MKAAEWIETFMLVAVMFVGILTMFSSAVVMMKIPGGVGERIEVIEKSLIRDTNQIKRDMEELRKICER